MLPQSGGRGLKLSELNEHLLCVLCGGYLVDATTIVECLHSFCRSCIVRHLEKNKACPKCDDVIHKTKPLINLRADRTLQTVVYKLVPGLYKDEMQRRRHFYADAPSGGPVSKEDHGDLNADSQLVYTEDEKISLCLQHCDRFPLWSSMGREKPSPENKKNAKNADKRFLLCPALVTVAHLKKFIRHKFDISSAYQVEIFHSNVSLRDACTLMDVANIYSWKRIHPLKLYYLVFDKSQLKLELPEPSENPIITTTIRLPKPSKKRADIRKKSPKTSHNKSVNGKSPVTSDRDMCSMEEISSIKVDSDIEEKLPLRNGESGEKSLGAGEHGIPNFDQESAEMEGKTDMPHACTDLDDGTKNSRKGDTVVKSVNSESPHSHFPMHVNDASLTTDSIDISFQSRERNVNDCENQLGTHKKDEKMSKLNKKVHSKAQSKAKKVKSIKTLANKVVKLNGKLFDVEKKPRKTSSKSIIVGKPTTPKRNLKKEKSGNKSEKSTNLCVKQLETQCAPPTLSCENAHTNADSLKLQSPSDVNDLTVVEQLQSASTLMPSSEGDNPAHSLSANSCSDRSRPSSPRKQINKNQSDTSTVVQTSDVAKKDFNSQVGSIGVVNSEKSEFAKSTMMSASVITQNNDKKVGKVSNVTEKLEDGILTSPPVEGGHSTDQEQNFQQVPHPGVSQCSTKPEQSSRQSVSHIPHTSGSSCSTKAEQNSISCEAKRCPIVTNDTESNSEWPGPVLSVGKLATNRDMSSDISPGQEGVLTLNQHKNTDSLNTSHKDRTEEQQSPTSNNQTEKIHSPTSNSKQVKENYSPTSEKGQPKENHSPGNILQIPSPTASSVVASDTPCRAISPREETGNVQSEHSDEHIGKSADSASPSFKTKKSRDKVKSINSIIKRIEDLKSKGHKDQAGSVLALTDQADSANKDHEPTSSTQPHYMATNVSAFSTLSGKAILARPRQTTLVQDSVNGLLSGVPHPPNYAATKPLPTPNIGRADATSQIPSLPPIIDELTPSALSIRQSPKTSSPSDLALPSRHLVKPSTLEKVNGSNMGQKASLSSKEHSKGWKSYSQSPASTMPVRVSKGKRVANTSLENSPMDATPPIKRLRQMFNGFSDCTEQTALSAGPLVYLPAQRSRKTSSKSHTKNTDGALNVSKRNGSSGSSLRLKESPANRMCMESSGGALPSSPVLMAGRVQDTCVGSSRSPRSCTYIPPPLPPSPQPIAQCMPTSPMAMPSSSPLTTPPITPRLTPNSKHSPGPIASVGRRTPTPVSAHSLPSQSLLVSDTHNPVGGRPPTAHTPLSLVASSGCHGQTPNMNPAHAKPYVTPYVPPQDHANGYDQPLELTTQLSRDRKRAQDDSQNSSERGTMQGSTATTPLLKIPSLVKP